MSADRPLSVAYAAVVELHQALGRPPLDGKVVEHTAGAWRVRWNGASQEQDGIPAFSMLLEYNGWPAGVLGPFDGVIAAGSAANEDAFIAAFAEAARAAREATPGPESP